MVSGTISLPCSGYFSPFPHGTGSLSVFWEYLALPDGPGRFRQDFTCPVLLRILLTNIKLTRTGLSPPMVRLSRRFRFILCSYVAVLQPHRRRNDCGLGYSPFDRHYLGNHFCFLFLRVLRCFSSPGLPPDCSGYQAFNLVGCPIRKPADIMGICPSPQLIAACHVLLRL